jgi:hypothetical protein
VVKRYRSLEEAFDPARTPPKPTTSERGPTAGKFIYLMAKVQAGLPLSVLDRDIILEALRKQWLTKREYAAFLRQAKLKHIEIARKVAKQAVQLGQREQWVEETHGFPTPRALKQFVKRERKHRR